MARRGTYPVPVYENKPATNALFRGDTEGTITEWKNDNLRSTQNFDQPTCPVSEYPKNHVWATARHVFELDDTGAGRINLHHGSGSFIELYPDGEIVIQAKKDVDIIAKQQVNILCDQNASIDVGKDCVVDVKGNLDAKVAENTTMKVGRDMKFVIEGRLDLVARDMIDIRSGADITFHGNNINQKANQINQDAYDGVSIEDDAVYAKERLEGTAEENAGWDDSWLMQNEEAHLHEPAKGEGKTWNKEVKESKGRQGNNFIQFEGQEYEEQLKALKSTINSAKETLSKALSLKF